MGAPASCSSAGWNIRTTSPANRCRRSAIHAASAAKTATPSSNASGSVPRLRSLRWRPGIRSAFPARPSPPWRRPSQASAPWPARKSRMWPTKCVALSTSHQRPLCVQAVLGHRDRPGVLPHSREPARGCPLNSNGQGLRGAGSWKDGKRRRRPGRFAVHRIGCPGGLLWDRAGGRQLARQRRKRPSRPPKVRGSDSCVPVGGTRPPRLSSPPVTPHPPLQAAFPPPRQLSASPCHGRPNTSSNPRLTEHPKLHDTGNT